MIFSTLTLLLICIGMIFFAWRRNRGELRLGVRLAISAAHRTVPLLILAFIIVGFVSVLQPQDLVRDLVGPGTGWQGLFIGAFAGALLPGGPYVVFPLIAALFQSGAGLGPVLAMVTSWATLALLTLSFELPFLGWRFSAIRLGLGLPFPLIVGFLGDRLFG